MSRSSRTFKVGALLTPLILLAACGSANGGEADGSGSGSAGFNGELGTAEQEARFQELYDKALEGGESEIVVYGPPPSRVLIDTFEDRFPGIEVNYQQLQSAERIAKLEQERQTGNYAGDVAADGRTPIVSMALDGWCQTLDPIMDVPDEWMGPNSAAMFPYVSVFGLAINTDLIQPEDAPKSWQELASEEWRDQIVMVSPAAGGAGAFTFAYMLTPEENVDKYAGIMEGVRENISLVSRDALVLQEVAQGNYPVGAMAYYPYYLEIKEQGAPLEFVFPFEEGGGNIWTKSANCVIDNAPNPNAAELYLNWFMSLEGQDTLSAAGWYPTMPGSDGPGALPPLEEIDLMEMLPDEVAITEYGPYVEEVIEFFGG